MRQYLKELRNKNKLFQRDVAEALGISQHYYSCIENGIKKKRMDVETLLKISALYGVSLKWLADQETEYLEKKGA